MKSSPTKSRGEFTASVTSTKLPNHALATLDLAKLGQAFSKRNPYMHEHFKRNDNLQPEHGLCSKHERGHTLLTDAIVRTEGLLSDEVAVLRLYSRS